MAPIYLVTGAAGHLGGTLIRLLRRRGAQVRGLLLPTETPSVPQGVEYVQGDIRDLDSLRPLFAGLEGRESYLIHTAGIVDISDQVSPLLYDVNVNGTKHILSLCREYQVKRLVYVSSVHAIPEGDKASVLHEVSVFSPDAVVGGYAKTKAEATQAVLDAARDGLDAVVVHPSGILGPYDRSGNHLVQLVTDYVRGKLPACVRGGYDFVDVRDVASGIVAAVEKGRSGECYILSGTYCEISHMLQLLHEISGRQEIKTILPAWFANLTAPLAEFYYKLLKQPPLYTKYSLYTLGANGHFSNRKAREELGYTSRPLIETLADTVTWLSNHRRIKPLPRMMH